MFGEISIWAWMGTAIIFAIGGATGFFISRQIKDKRTLELEEKLTTARNELAGYRGDVNQHFLKTSLLLGKLTNNYREVYEHLATGAQKLCNENPNTPELDLPDTKILTSMDIVEDDDPAIELAAETMVEIPEEAKEETQPEKTQAVEASAENTEQIQDNLTDEATVIETTEKTIEEKTVTAESSEKTDAELSSKESERPSPEDIPDSEDNEDDVHLGAESAPSVNTEPHKTNPSIH